MTPWYVDDAVTVWHGDCLDVLAALAGNTVDAVVTDPPYGLEFMGKDWDRFGSTGRDDLRHRQRMANAPEPQKGNPWASERKSYGAVKKNPRCRDCGRLKWAESPCRCEQPDWDLRVTESMHQYQQWCQTWAEQCHRVLKPGGHLLAFGGTRTHHRLACAIEDAGFEIRSSIAWLTGQGFPKSLNPYRSIMGRCPSSATVPHAVRLSPFTPVPSNGAKGSTALALARIQPEDDPVLLTQTGEAADSYVQTGMSLSALTEITSLSTDSLLSELSAALYEPTNTSTTSTTSRTTTASRIWSSSRSLFMQAPTTEVASPADGCKCPVFTVGTRSNDGALKWSAIPVLTAPALVTAAPLRPLEARGTDTKPAFEPIVVARKPLAGTVAANVLIWGTGALNIDAARVGTDEDTARKPAMVRDTAAPFGRGMAMGGNGSTAGRWPPNVALDPHTAAALDQQSGILTSNARINKGTGMGYHGGQGGPRNWELDDSGGASRFFPVFRYEPKAPTLERPRVPGTPGAIAANVCANCGRQDLSGSRCECPEPEWIPRGEAATAHPTVKPLDLMRWLVRLVTPPGGLVLDPFLGSGTTAEACIVEGFRCVGVERETAYLPMIRARLTKPIQPVLDLGEL